YWARLASVAPSFVNSVTHAPLLRDIVKFFGGVAPQRELPRFAKQTFRAWFAKHESPVASHKRIILWPDTFNNYFLPQTAIAAVEVLEHAGFRVDLPKKTLCCGRPLYDYGMLRLAKSFLKSILDELREDIRAGVPVVGLEPSCVAVFRDEMLNLFPHDLDAKRLASQVFTLAEFLEREGWQPPMLHRKALVQRHCHHQAVMGFDSDKKMLEQLGLELEIPDSGCCGMAGSFGYEHGERYDVSVKCAERALLPKVREAPADTLIVADGFSCREQIQQLSGKKALHLADILQMALARHHDVVRGNGKHNGRIALRRVAAIAAGTLAAGTIIAWRTKM
ncbi:MAG: (Fe-S)-binding protein, partial [Vulcanimicrobiaceae bacterium]